MISKKVLFLLFIYFLTQFAHTLEKTDFVISFLPVVMKDLDTEYLHIANTIPGLLYENLKYASNHKLSEEEITSIQENELKELKIKCLLELSALKEQYDGYIFSSNFNESESLNLKDEIFNKKIELSKLNISDIILPDSYLPIKYLEKFEKTTDIKSSNLETSDIIVKGFMEKLDEWVYLEIWVENKILNKEDLIYKSIGSKENLSVLIPEISSRLKTIILGRPWASLNLNPDPGGSNVLLTDNTGSEVRGNPEFLYPGFYNIKISQQGYITKNISVELEEFESISIDYKMIQEDKGIVSVQSFPSGADLYSGANWLGKTPLLIKSPVIPSLITFKLEGYNDSKYIYSESANKNINLFMQSSLIDRDNIINKKRNNFYKSFSYFIVSIPITMLSFGMSSDYGYAYNNETVAGSYSSESNRLMQLSTTWYNVYLGSVFINISLFINTIFDLVDYINGTSYL